MSLSVQLPACLRLSVTATKRRLQRTLIYISLLQGVGANQLLVLLAIAVASRPSQGVSPKCAVGVHLKILESTSHTHFAAIAGCGGTKTRGTLLLYITNCYVAILVTAEQPQHGVPSS